MRCFSLRYPIASTRFVSFRFVWKEEMSLFHFAPLFRFVDALSVRLSVPFNTATRDA